MRTWIGAAAICFDHQKVLLVRNKDVLGWRVPSGGLETGETLDECCIREVKEETGYSVDTVKKLLVKEKESDGYQIQTHYYLVGLTDTLASSQIDQDISAVQWVSIDSMHTISHLYQEDVQIILDTYERFQNKLEIYKIKAR
ncbi:MULTISPECIES: NUDIX hydrolase [unclassified Exiguobacterium]|uniref:NUDIX hydrolase n=1 Tax=unclassified Exiguobacterium TaxID=2644629 RepID=UPI00103B36CE|nr:MULTISPECIES: NUDIX hydrolase [unclassified Exiguobacterium]TCI43498.1 NUDIX hydrolase [Exiguobacterium sp. SH5S32]TCI52446.1 NUDIX hydrolase [Exiguobacterium sp. SH1S4]TCI68753.1 NUDIX hydrolase [Exiguobacterium sp. SH1S1]